MRVTGYLVAHYGREYMREAVAALAPHVDRLMVLYTPEPSFGHCGNIACPDTEEQLRACCDGFPVDWIRGIWPNEGEHRQHAIALAADSDLIVTADTDEVWSNESLAWCIRQAYDGAATRYLIHGFVHFWRSFDRACRDVWAPVRIIKPSGAGDTTINGTVYHMGYASSEPVTRYKMSCHGHKNEIRPGWFTQIFMEPGRTRDLHPVVAGWWNAEPFDKAILPPALRSHPNYSLDLIR